MPYTDYLSPQTMAPPTLDPDLFQTPENFAKSARVVKEQKFQEQLDSLLRAGTGYANYLTATETSRYGQSLGTLRRGASQFDKPTLTDQDIARMFSGSADTAGRELRANMGELRSYLGKSGSLGGNFGAAQAVNFEAKRLASITDARRALYEKRIDYDLNDRMARWNASQAVAAAEGRDPSVVGLDWLTQAGAMALGGRGLQMQASATRHAEDAAKDAAMYSLGGQVFGGLLSAVG